MKLTVKNLKGGSCLVDVTEKTTILELKKRIEKDIKIPAAQQTLVLMGKSLQDEKRIEDYPKVKDGTKLYVAEKKPETLNSALNRFLQKYYSEEQCKLIIDEFMRNFQNKIDNLSLDDLERIAKSEIQS
nr:unnamed protein product [Callosobruchus chinensis]